MRILWVKAGKLLPLDTGGKIRSYNILRFLAQRHEVTLLSYYSGRRDHEYELAIQKELGRTEIVSTGGPEESALAQGLDYLWRLPNPAPFAVSKFTDTTVRNRVAERLSSGQFDVAVCDFLSASLNFPNQPLTPTALFQHNVESSLWQRMAKTESSPVKRLAYKIESVKMTCYERAALRKFHHTIAVSEQDRQQMLAMDAACEITVVPTGVDTAKFTPAPPSRTPPEKIVFLGSMDWEPNIDAVEYFCREMWPQIHTQYRQALFQVVGRNPHAKVRRLASSNVEVTGTVASVEEYLREATLVVVPLRIGGGTRLKIFEAMAMGKAIVSTSIGAEGLDVQSGHDLILADHAQDFTAAVLGLLADQSLRHRIERAAVNLASQYDWSKIAERFAEVLSRIVKKKAPQGSDKVAPVGP